MEAVNSNLIKYLVWLNCFTNKHKEITNSGIITSEYSNIDIYNLSIIGKLYNLIEEYASSMGIIPIKTEYETYYCIEYWESYYIIGNRFHIENEDYCIRVESLDNPIDMCDVLDYQNNKGKNNNETIKRVLKVKHES